ncbi:YybH family protein [Algirhabdus cladophorae]|uniref:YybH family protein n=1 Tax=Algirhabdus cladophorae TaxID=3377108 RepID=UPI003B845552
MRTRDQARQEALDFINSYNACFYKRDLDALKALYSPQNFTKFWDNHPGCDSPDLEDHFGKVSTFFKTGKQSESGTIEPLIVEDLHALAVGNTLLVTAILRYQSAPVPGVRSTFALLKENGAWKAAHIHHSFDPNEAG